jgi:hypothetical protein
MAPQRIRQRRTKGWRKPEGAVGCARPSRYGNPFSTAKAADIWIVHDIRIGKVVAGCSSEEAARRYAVELFAADLAAGRLAVTVEDVREELAGRDLMCFCGAGQPCHVDVLLRVAGGGAP